MTASTLPKRRSPVTTALLVVAAVLAIGGAGYMTWSKYRVEQGQPDTPDSAAAYICTSCNVPFELTPAAYSRLCKEGGIANRGQRERGGAALRCPKCGQFAGEPATTCPHDRTIFAPFNKAGEANKCSKCGWTP